MKNSESNQIARWVTEVYHCQILFRVRGGASSVYLDTLSREKIKDVLNDIKSPENEPTFRIILETNEYREMLTIFKEEAEAWIKWISEEFTKEKLGTGILVEGIGRLNLIEKSGK